MALRLLPSVSRSLRSSFAVLPATRSVSRTPEQLGIFDWLTKKAQPSNPPNVPPHSTSPSPQQASSDPSLPASSVPEASSPSNASPASPVDSSSSPATPSSSPVDASSSEPSSSTSTSSSSSSASSSSSSSSSSSPLWSTNAVVTPAPTHSSEGALSPLSSQLPSPFTPPPTPPPPPPPPATDRWTALNEARRQQLFGQNARAGNKMTGRMQHFRPGDVSRAIGQIQTVVRVNDIRVEAARHEYFEANPLRRWRKKRAYWADYITVKMRENVQAVRVLRARNQLPRR